MLGWVDKFLTESCNLDKVEHIYNYVCIFECHQFALNTNTCRVQHDKLHTSTNIKANLGTRFSNLYSKQSFQTFNINCILFELCLVVDM